MSSETSIEPNNKSNAPKRFAGDVGGWEKRLGSVVPSIRSIEGVIVGGFVICEVDGLDEARVGRAVGSPSLTNVLGKSRAVRSSCSISSRHASCSIERQLRIDL